MGTPTAEVPLRNPRRPDLGTVHIEALAEPGPCIPPALPRKLAPAAIDTRPATLADDATRRAPHVGPIETRWQARVGFTGALVTGDEPLPGTIPLEEMDLVVVPKTGEVMANPANPDGPGTIAKAPRTKRGARSPWRRTASHRPAEGTIEPPAVHASRPAVLNLLGLSDEEKPLASRLLAGDVGRGVPQVARRTRGGQAGTGTSQRPSGTQRCGPLHIGGWKRSTTGCRGGPPRGR